MHDMASRSTRWVALIGFMGLVAMALLTMADALLRWLNLARIPGFGDYGELVFPVVLASCFPAGLLQNHNITIRFLGRGLPARLSAWPELVGALATLVFFSLLVWQFTLLTMDLQANSRTTRTIELPVAPWWWITTVIMGLTVPVQVLVVVETFLTAWKGRPPVVHDQVTSEVDMMEER